MTHWYRIYGLTVSSEFPLAELEPCWLAEELPADVVIQKRSIEVSDTTAAANYLLRASPEEAIFVHPLIGVLLMRRGRQILIDPRSGVDEAGLSPFILGAPMSVLLSQRGLTVLHASSILIGSEAVAFVGHKGAGKSVLAASLARKGYPLLADDVTAVSQRDADLTLIPASPQIRLLPDALRALGVESAALPKVHALDPKRIWRVTDSRLPSVLPLKRIYVLTQDEHIAIDRLTPIESFVELLRHAYLSRWPGLAHQSPDHFRRLSALANQVPVFRLRRPHHFTAMPALIEALEAAR
jgi:hypothetical protein